MPVNAGDDPAPLPIEEDRTELDESNNKYFREAASDIHNDQRFAHEALSYEHHRASLVLLAQTCLTTLADLGVETWLMHGSLLGWCWNQRMLPWDPDVDLQISEESMSHLSRHFDQSIHRFRVGDTSVHRSYLLDINPNFRNVDIMDSDNKIDARWIDMDTGLFLDFTVLHRDPDPELDPGAMMCKDGHRYDYNDIYPLRETTFEGVPAKVPAAFAKLVEAEYSGNALTNIDYEGHVFIKEMKEWMPYRAPDDQLPLTAEQPTAIDALDFRKMTKEEMVR